MILLGIDPGLASTGFGVVEGDSHKAGILEFGCVRTPAGTPMGSRLDSIYLALQLLIEKWRPGGISMEDIFSAPRLPHAAMQLGEVRGVVNLLASRSGLQVMQLPAREVKRALTGNGAADKEQVERALRRTTGWTEPIRPTHASDALAIAVVGLSRWSSKALPK